MFIYLMFSFFFIIDTRIAGTQPYLGKGKT